MKRSPRWLSTSVKGSHTRRQKRAQLAKAWQRVREREHGDVHELTAGLVNTHASRFVVESLRIKTMVKKHRLAKSIHDQPWDSLVSWLTDKSATAGGSVKRVNPKKMSPWGSTCGALPEQNLTRDDRLYHGASCGMVCDREIKAAMNVLQVGLATHESGGNPPMHSEKEVHKLECQVENAEPYALVT